MYHAIVFLPLLGFLIVGLFGARLGAKASEYITCGFMVVAALLSWVAFYQVAWAGGEAFTVPVMRWIQSGGLDAAWALRIDTLTAVMLVVVNTVSCLVHIYSIGYMHHDPHRPRFFAYLSLFTFAMLMLVTSDNLVQMFFGWEGVGLASYLLIGFWYHKPSANAAAIKAFVVNRVGDFGFALGIFGVFVLFGSVNFETIFANAATYLPAVADAAAHGAAAIAPAADAAAHGAAPAAEAAGHAAEVAAPAGEAVLTFLGYHLDKASAITIVCLLLFMGAMGKSAQVRCTPGCRTPWKARRRCRR
jgi:NADH-quinone oxidoreductase subunit L